MPPAPDAVLLTDTVWYLLLAIPVLAILAAAATRSMNRRGATGWIFGLLVAFLPPVGLIIWAIATVLTPAPDHTPPPRSRPRHLPRA